MGKVYPSILPEHEAFIEQQQVFFVGTAAQDGHVNLSPKGHDVFRILSPNQVAYLDLTGSGNETSAHLNQVNRITYMFMAFDGKPMILRLYGDGTVVLPGTAEWEALIQHFNMIPGARQIIVSQIEQVKTSCGFSVPFYTYEGERDTLIQWAEKQGEDGLKRYRQNKNSVSMDGFVTPIGRMFEQE